MPRIAVICALAGALQWQTLPPQVRASDIKLYADDPDPRGLTFDYSDRGNPGVDDGFGVFGRTGYWASRNFGINDPLTHVEAMPYFLNDEHFFFTDLRGYITNYSRFGGNFGAGYRFLDPVREGWYGGSVWYDADDSSGELFQQVGLSGELVMPWFELRSNVYLPVGGRSATLANQVGGLRFVGHQLIYGQQTQTARSLTGFDMEAGAPLPLPFLGSQDQLRGFAGWYYFAGDSQDNIIGFKARAEAVVNNTVSAQVAFTTDDQNGSEVGVGVALQMPWGDHHPSSKWSKDVPSPFRFVERNYSVILERDSSQGLDLIARDPATGDPYFFEHVSANGNANGDGSFQNPFASIAQAQGAGGGDVIFVHADTIVTDQVALASGERILGDGVQHSIDLQGFGPSLLPMLSAAGDLPEINVASGPAVTLASNAEFSGFALQDSIIGQNVSDVTLRHLLFENISGDAINLQNLGGSSVLGDLTFNTIGGSAVVINSGSPSIELTDLDVNTTSGDAVVLSNLTNTIVTIEDLSITDSSASGLVLGALIGSVDVISASVADTAVDGIRVSGGDADVTFSGSTSIDSDQGRGFVLSGSGGVIDVANLTVEGAGTGAAVVINNMTDDVIMSSLTINRTAGAGLVADGATSLAINAGTITTIGGAAVDLQNSANDITLTAVNVDQANYGIRLVDTTGSFMIAGSAIAHSGGTIQNVTTGVLLDNAGTVELDWLRLQSMQTGVQSSGTGYLALNRLNATGLSGYAVDSINDRALFIGSSTFTDNGALGDGTLRMQTNEFSNYQVTISDNIITDANGKAIQILNSGSSAGSSLTLALRNNLITASRDGQAATQVAWNGPLGVEVSGNTFHINGASMTGVELASLSGTSNFTSTITQNTMYLNGAQATGYRVAASATSSVEFSSNGLQFTGNNGTGFAFTGVGTSTLYLRNNNLVSTAATGTTGFLMSNLAAGSTVQINSNTLNFADGTNIMDRGFVFTTLANPVSLQGTSDNLLTGVLQPLIIPSGQTTGGFFINSVYQQP